MVVLLYSIFEKGDRIKVNPVKNESNSESNAESNSESNAESKKTDNSQNQDNSTVIEAERAYYEGGKDYFTPRPTLAYSEFFPLSWAWKDKK